MESTSSAKVKGSSQKEMLFMRGNAMSGAPIIRGTSQLPKPPIMAGMIMKKIMIRPWPVTKTLKVCGSLKTCRPGYISSARIIIEKKPPMQPAHDREDQVHRADVLVVGGIDIAPPAGGVVGVVAAAVMEVFVMCVEGEIGHGAISYFDATRVASCRDRGEFLLGSGKPGGIIRVAHHIAPRSA